MDLSMICRRVSAFASRVIQADCLANPEMRRSNNGMSRGDFRRKKEDYSQYKCSIAVVYHPQHPLSGSQDWLNLFKTIGVALNAQSYWIKEVVSLPLCKVNGKVPFKTMHSPVYLAPVTHSDYEPITEHEALKALGGMPLVTILLNEHQIILKLKDSRVELGV